MSQKTIDNVLKEHELSVDQLVKMIDQCQSFRIFQVIDEEKEAQVLISIKK